LYGNIIYTIGSILVAASTNVRSYKFMIVGRVILAFGDIATQIAQYKIFSSWFSPNNGFASTLGLELGLGKIGAFIGKSTANIIAEVYLIIFDTIYSITNEFRKPVISLGCSGLQYS
jgi:MFS family permease